MNRLVPLVAAAAFLFTFTAIASHAVDPVAKCQSSKLKAWGKRRSCEDKAAAKGVLGGIADPAECQAKFDAALVRAGMACRYLSMEPGTVTDLDTGLMWQRTDDDGGVTDKDNTYTWCVGTAPNCNSGSNPPDGTAFTVFLARLNFCRGSAPDDQITYDAYASHCDWRLPQIDELTKIVDCSFGDPCIDQSAFGPTIGASNGYHSATTFSNLPTGAWNVNFIDGTSPGGWKYNAAHVRAVRVGL